jgi:hypothetical protein
MKHSAGAGQTEQQAAALEIVRREALRSGRSPRSVLSLVRVSHPPTKSEQLLLSAVRLLRSPHAIMPHSCAQMEEWLARYAEVICAAPLPDVRVASIE